LVREARRRKSGRLENEDVNLSTSFIVQAMNEVDEREYAALVCVRRTCTNLPAICMFSHGSRGPRRSLPVRDA